METEKTTTKGKRWLGDKPEACDLCGRRITDEFVDGKTQLGSWANMCLPCHKTRGVGLGTGKGQHYKASGDDPCFYKVLTSIVATEGSGKLRRPTDAQLDAWMMDTMCEATDGCEVEHDGTCEHGKPSWLLKLGLV